MICDSVFIRSLKFSANPHSKQSQVSLIKIIKHYSFEGVYSIILNIKTKNADFFCKKNFCPIRKHCQFKDDYITKRVAVQNILNQSFNILFNISLMVAIHERGNILVWIVVNCKIPLIEIFYNKEQALALVSILQEYERKHYKRNVTHTIYVERDTDRLSGIIEKNPSDIDSERVREK